VSIEDYHGSSSSTSPLPHSAMSGGGAGDVDELLAPVSTLDEPVMETIMRDVRAVGAKLRAVLIPLDRNVSVCNCWCTFGRVASFVTSCRNLS
jgi:hypothetical protein